MRIILSDRPLETACFPADVKIESVNIKTMKKFDNREDVIAIVGSRAMAIACSQMQLPNLALFQLTSAGFDRVPLDWFASHNVLVANAGSVYSVPIAETVLFGVLACAKRLHKNPGNRRFKLTRRYHHTITEVAQKHVIILGAGNIGTAIANRLAGFDMTIDGFDPFCPDKPQYRTILRTRESLLATLNEYDYIITTLPDNDQTRHSLDETFFSAAKKGAVIINVGRKAIFDETALYHALKTEHLSCAVLDMFEKLPNPITNRFRRLKNVLVLPGVAAISKETAARLRMHIQGNLCALLSGAEVKNTIR